MAHYSLSTEDRRTYRRYANLALPRHTSYPIAPVWRSDYGPEAFSDDLRNIDARDPLSLYVHIPYCAQLCYYCACTKEIVPASKRHQLDPANALLDSLTLEAERLTANLQPCKIHQLHLGGGSPTFLQVEQLERLWHLLTHTFHLADDAEIAVEIDPRITTYEQLQTLRQLGFNRISLGIQDFDPKVQSTVNRIQPFDQVQQCLAWCRSLAFASINFDLIYGLPCQTLETMSDTLDQTIALAPDRIAFYRLAVIPDIFRWQNTFSRIDLPSGDLALDLNLLAINRFLNAGYEFIGLDHFARPNESLAQAQRDGSLFRNFQGMTTGKHLQILGLGPSAISQLDHAFAQNDKSSHDWSCRLEHHLATVRGLRLSNEDRLRRELLQQLYGHGVIDKPTLEKQFDIRFDQHFARELAHLHDLQQEGLVTLTNHHVSLTVPLGRLLVRVVAAVFDQYLPPNAYRDGLSAQLASKVG